MIRRKKVDVRVALILIVIVAVMAWWQTALSGVVAGTLSGLAIYCFIRVSGWLLRENESGTGRE